MKGCFGKASAGPGSVTDCVAGVAGDFIGRCMVLGLENGGWRWNLDVEPGALGESLDWQLLYTIQYRRTMR